MSTRKCKSFGEIGKRGKKIKIRKQSRQLSDRQQQWPVCLCRECRGELYRGDEFWQIEGAAVCGDCLETFARRYFAPCRTTGEEQLYEEEKREHYDADATVF